VRSFPVRWQFMGDPSISNITAWVRKKVPELVGMEEPDLVEFIMGHVRQHASAGEWRRACVCSAGVALCLWLCFVVYLCLWLSLLHSAPSFISPQHRST
jgi:hypothetical protein